MYPRHTIKQPLFIKCKEHKEKLFKLYSSSNIVKMLIHILRRMGWMRHVAHREGKFENVYKILARKF
jgi:hypothetical protein